jgi:hypothetical protein
MRIIKVEQPVGIAIPVSHFRTPIAEIQEKTHGLLHWIRAWSYGECPSCHGTHNKQVFGWNKMQCKQCGETWTY